MRSWNEEKQKNVVIYISVGWDIIRDEPVLPYQQVNSILFIQFFVPFVRAIIIAPLNLSRRIL